jgi:hypothetical protein
MAGASTIARGNIFNTIIVQAVLTPAAVLANTTAEQNFTVTGLVTGDQVSAINYLGAFPNSDVSPVNMRCSSANTLTVAYQNGTGGVLTPPAGNYYIEINRPENLPPPGAIV